MANLLPLESKKKLDHEYHKRLFVVASLLNALLSVTAILLLIPSYMLASIEFGAVKKEQLLTRNGINDVERQRIEENVKNLKGKIDFLGNATKETTASQIIEEVLGRRIRGISILGIGYANKTVSIRGTADDRQSLVAFTEELKREQKFKGVDVPLASLIAGENIPFSLEFRRE